MCPSCGILSTLEEAGEGIAIAGSHGFVSRTVADVYESFKFDADVVLIFLPKGVESCMNLQGLAVRPMSEVFALGECRVYTRDAIARDCLAGVPLRRAVEGFLNA